jgi:hypothetical protein
MLGVMRISVNNGTDCVTTNVEHKMGPIPHPASGCGADGRNQ